ncbi:MAG: hypothetical protein ACI8Q1_001093 [Parvicella sp.]|jgi:hypothetical protein
MNVYYCPRNLDFKAIYFKYKRLYVIVVYDLHQGEKRESQKNEGHPVSNCQKKGIKKTP